MYSWKNNAHQLSPTDFFWFASPELLHTDYFPVTSKFDKSAAAIELEQFGFGGLHCQTVGHIISNLHSTDRNNRGVKYLAMNKYCDIGSATTYINQAHP